MADAPTEAPERNRRRLFWPGGLSARLLVLTVVFAALGGPLAIPPAMAAYEQQWLLDRVRAAELASLAPEVAPDRVVSEQLKTQLLEGAGVEIVAVSIDGARSLVFSAGRPSRAPYLVDLRPRAAGLALFAPFQTLLGDGGRVRVMAEPRFRKEADFIEFVATDTELKRALASYLWRLVAIVAGVAALAGVIVFFALNLFLVRPMQRITFAMERFRADPEDPAAQIQLSGRRDEIGRAEAELDRMQADLRAALHSRARLAALGAAGYRAPGGRHGARPGRGLHGGPGGRQPHPHLRRRPGRADAHARTPVPALRRLRPPGLHRPRSRHRPRTGPGPRRRPHPLRHRRPGHGVRTAVAGRSTAEGAGAAGGGGGGGHDGGAAGGPPPPHPS